MAEFINIFNKIFASLLCSILAFTGGLNTIFNGDVAEFKDLGGVFGLESLTRSQGVTTDGESIIYSGKNALERVDKDNSTVLAINTNAIPEEFAALGVKHIGGISYYNGYIYASLEDSKVWQHSIIALYDAKTLEYTGIYYELNPELHKHGLPWVAVDGENGILYTDDFYDPQSIQMYDLETMEYLGVFTCYGADVEQVQGGEVYNGKLYLGTNDMMRAVFSIDLTTGETEKLFDRIACQYKYIDNFGGEGEDLTVMEIDGEMMICTLQIGVTFTDATLRGYTIP